MRKHLMATVALSALLVSGSALGQTQQPSTDDAAQASEPAGAADTQTGAPESTLPVQTPTTSAQEGGEDTGTMTDETEAATDDAAATAEETEAATDAATDDAAATTEMAAGIDPTQYMGRDIVAADGQKVGEVQRIIMDDQGQPEAVVFKSGGFLGLGGKEVEVAWDEVQTEGEQLLLSIPPEQVAELPEARPEMAGEGEAGTEAEAGATEGEEATEGETAQ